MSLKSPKTSLQPQMPELQFLKALIFPRVLKKDLPKLQN